MFDDQTNNPSQPPANLPTAPDDMFAGIEGDEKTNNAVDLPATPPNALDAGVLKKKENTPKTPGVNDSSAAPVQPVYAIKEPVFGKILLFIFILAVLAGLGFGGWWVYGKYFKTTTNTNLEPELVNVVTTSEEVGTGSEMITTEEKSTVEEEVETNTTTSVTTSGDIPTQVNSDKILFGEQLDSDKDGLPDDMEKNLGTNLSKIDTDNDGLSDYDEVMIWKTDPLKADSDNDSYQDGKEIRNGYDPLGPGKLKILPAGASTSTIKLPTATK